MTHTQSRRRLALSFAILNVCALMPASANAQTVTFSTADAGQTKSIANWGVEVAWLNSDNMRQSIANIGAAQIDLVAGNFYLDEALTSTGDLGPNSKASIDAQMQMLLTAGNKSYVLGPTVGNTNAYYFNGSALRTDRYAALIKATKTYINTKWNVTVAGVMPFNEPDYWGGQGSTGDLRTILTTLKNDSSFANVSLIGGSTLNSDLAQGWYDPVSDVVKYGSTHVLGGNANSYANFFQHVTAAGGTPSAPELHGLGEAIYAAQYGSQQGLWWGGTLRARGLFVQASDGKQLGYAENRANDTAAAVYRAPDGSIRAFAGGFERMGATTAYRFVSSDRDVYMNGVGPLREFMVQAGQGEDAYADVQYGENVMPALDGSRWELVNKQTGQVLQVSGAATNNGAILNAAANTGALSQQWNIVRNKDGYFALFNANSGLTADVLNGSLSNSAVVDQWGNADNLIQHWYFDDAGSGNFFIRNGNSNKYLTSSTVGNVFQYDKLTSNLQQWQFVRTDPAASTRLKTQYKFDANLTDVKGGIAAVVSGTPSYVASARGQGTALSFNGTSTYAQLPSGVASSKDITISALVKWDGGAAWQRIFDFGNDTNSYMFLTPSSSAGLMHFGITTGSNSTEQILETSALPIGQWVHLALTLGGNTGVLYVNGVPRVAGQILLNPSDINSTLNYLGKSQYNDPLFKGSIDDFRIYDYGLNAQQVASLVPTTWGADISGNWSVATNWTFGNVPNGAGRSATFAAPITATRTVTLDTPVSLGVLNFNATPGYVVAGTVPLTLDALPGESALVNVLAGSHTISTPLVFADDTLVTVLPGASMDVTNTFDGGVHLLSKAGIGTLQLGQLRNVALDLQAGTVRIAQQNGASTAQGTSKVTSLSIAAGASLDLTNNGLAIDYTAASTGSLLTDVRSHLAAGRIVAGGFDPNGPLAIGYVDNVMLHRASFAGLAVDDTSLLMQVTLKGDADLSGSVGFDDLLALAQNYNGGTNQVWSQGDFNYDGVVDFSDLLSLAQNYNGSLSVANAAMLDSTFASDLALAQSLVPEPSTLATLVIVAAAATSRARRSTPL